MKVLLIGIDGGELSIIQKGISKGMLPTFKHLLCNGIYSELNSTIPPGTATAWVSMVTGVNPGKHGIFDFIDWKTEKVLSSIDVKSPAIWEIIEQKNMNSIIINVPFTYPPKKIKGVIIPGIPLPLDHIYTYPNNLKSYLDKMGYVFDFGEYDALKYILIGKEYALLNYIKEITEKRTTIAQILMRSINWNFCMVVYTAIDRIQHVAFHNTDVILNAYKIIDNNIKILLNNIDDETAVIIVSDHGFERTYQALYLNEILRRLKIIRFNYSELIISMFFQHVMRLLSNFPKIIIGKLLEKMNSEGKLMTTMLGLLRGKSLISQQEARVVSSYGRYSYLYVKNKNIKAKLTATLKNLKVPYVEDDLIVEVIPAEKIYNGEYVSKSPDLILKHGQGYSVFTIVPATRIITKIAKSLEPRTGGHKLQGILIVYGKKFLKQNLHIINTSIYDIAPTVLSLLDLSVSCWMDGKPIAEILRAFDQRYFEFHKDENQVVVKKEEEHENIYTPEEEQKIKERLRKLGYL